MNTASRIKQLVKPILKRNPDLVMVGSDTLWLGPVRHIGRQIHFRRSRASYFTLEWHLSEMFVPRPRPASAFGWFNKNIGRSKIHNMKPFGPYRTNCPYTGEHEHWNWGTGIWYYSDPSIGEDLQFQIEAVLRLMRSLDTLTKCLAFLRLEGPSNLTCVAHWGMLMDIAVGHIEPARDHWITVRHTYRHECLDPTRSLYGREYGRYQDLDAPLMARDRPALASLFHEWEAANAHYLQVDRLWEKSAFPFESSE